MLVQAKSLWKLFTFSNNANLCSNSIGKVENLSCCENQVFTSGGLRERRISKDLHLTPCLRFLQIRTQIWSR